MHRTIAIVFARDYSKELKRLAFRIPVWMVDTPENRAAAAETWQAAIEWPHINVTLFRPDDDLHTLLAQIAIEHAIDGVEVIGSPLTNTVRAALAKEGFERFDETPEGFRARKT